MPPLLPNDHGTIAVKVHLCCDITESCATQISLMSQATIYPLLPNECSLTDHVSARAVRPCCSSDPNDCTVTPKGCGPEGLIQRDQALTYQIQFQNEGGGPAHVVVLQDVLDEDLDLDTLEILSSSHPYFLERNGRELLWIFPDIELAPQGLDEEASRGFVRFRIRPRADAPAGTVINNSAAIYFDFNDAVVTLTTINTITEDPVPVAAFTVVPQPGSANAVFDFLYTGGTANAQFQWNFGPAAIPSTSSQMNPTGVMFTTPGPHLVGLEVRLGDCAAEPAVQSVTVGPPTIQCPGDIIATTDPGQCSAVVTFTATAGNDRPGVTIVCSPASGSAFSKGTTTVHCTATDAAGNTASCSFTVTVTDAESPVITCPENIELSNDPGTCARPNVTFKAKATDNCPGVTIAFSIASGSTFPTGTTPVTVTATDASGNQTTCTFTVTVNATENPGNLYPIALSATTLAGVTPGSLLPDIFNGIQPGNFGWLTWAGSPNVPTLPVSLTPPGDSSTYVNPANTADHVISVGDWVKGKPGVANSSNVRNALDVLKTIDINVPIWDQTSGNGNNTMYRVVGFAKVRIINYQLPGQNRITARYLGPACP